VDYTEFKKKKKTKIKIKQRLGYWTKNVVILLA